MGGALGAISGLAPRTASPEDEPQVVGQSSIGAMACGPCALYNALANGSGRQRRALRKLSGKTDEERIRYLIERYGGSPSVAYEGKRALYTEDGGMADEDLAPFASPFLEDASLPAASGQLLNRREGERLEAHLRRVHEALSAKEGLRPLIAIRSFGAETSGDRPLWNGLFGHWLCVLSVSELRDDEPTGFLLECADSGTGRVIPVFCHTEQHRNFTATLGFDVDEAGKEVWKWQSDRPYLLVTAPDLNLRTSNQDWYERTIVTLRYLVR